MAGDRRCRRTRPPHTCRDTARPVAQEFSQTGGVDTRAKVARVATNPVHAHWEAIERILRYSPGILDPRFTHAEVSSPQKGYPNPTAAWLWSGTPHRGARSPSMAAPPPYPQGGRPPLGAATHCSDVQRQGGVMPLQPHLKHLFGHTAETHGGKEASWPRSPASYTSQQPSRPRASGVTTMRERRNHPHPITTRATQQPTRSPAPSLSAKGEALRRIRVPWTARKVRGSVAEMAVGPPVVSVGYHVHTRPLQLVCTVVCSLALTRSLANNTVFCPSSKTLCCYRTIAVSLCPI